MTHDINPIRFHKHFLVELWKTTDPGKCRAHSQHTRKVFTSGGLRFQIVFAGVDGMWCHHQKSQQVGHNLSTQRIAISLHNWAVNYFRWKWAEFGKDPTAGQAQINTWEWVQSYIVHKHLNNSNCCQYINTLIKSHAKIEILPQMVLYTSLKSKNTSSRLHHSIWFAQSQTFHPKLHQISGYQTVQHTENQFNYQMMCKT